MVSNRVATLLGIGGLAVMAALMFLSSRGDSITMDEDGDIAAGYSYLRKSDFRLNPEHPPLMKDLAAFPLLWMNLNEPWDHNSWTEEVNGTSEFARTLIFHSGNDADRITQAARAPMILFTIAFGLALFLWTQRVFGNSVALLTTFFFLFSPTFLAHGRLATNDVGASAGFFLATIAYLRFLKTPTIGSVVLAGLSLGLALLTKFSTFLLVPTFLLLTLVWAALIRNRALITCPDAGPPGRSQFWWWLLRYAAIVILACLTIYPLYWHHTRRYPRERQTDDTKVLLGWLSVGAMHRAASLMKSHNVAPQLQPMVRAFPRNLVIFASSRPILRPYATYALGLLFILGRATYGNTKYFLGDVSGPGSRLYFPFVYLVKEPLALHIFTFLALACLCASSARARSWPEIARVHFTEVAFMIVISVYWVAAIRSNLNIGVRHMLPIFPFVYILAALGARHLHQRVGASRAMRWGTRIVVAMLIGWQAFSVTSLHPYYLAYFNEIAGGPDGGYRYVVDSNLDWGQDLKRLAQFVDGSRISRIDLDYFGRAEPTYYLGDKFRPLVSSDEPRKGWIAVSASLYQNSRAEPAHNYRRWLPLSQRVATIGHSIFIFHIE